MPSILSTTRLLWMWCGCRLDDETVCQVYSVSGNVACGCCCTMESVYERIRAQVMVIHLRRFQRLGHQHAADNSSGVYLPVNAVNSVPSDERWTAAVQRKRKGNQARSAEMLGKSTGHGNLCGNGSANDEGDAEPFPQPGVPIAFLLF